MKPGHSLTIFETSYLATKFVAKVIGTPTSLAAFLMATRRFCAARSGFIYTLRHDDALAALIIGCVIILGHWIIQNAVFRLPDGRPLFLWQTSVAWPPQMVPIALLVGVFCAVVIAFWVSLLSILGSSPTSAKFWTILASVIASLPLLRCALLSSDLFTADRNRYLAKRNARSAARRKEEERKRLAALIVPPKPPETFESKVRDITSEHEQRVQQLKRVPLDEDEREYLIELETSRFKDAIRALTDPSLGPSNITDNRNDLPT